MKIMSDGIQEALAEERMRTAFILAISKTMQEASRRISFGNDLGLLGDEKTHYWTIRELLSLHGFPDEIRFNAWNAFVFGWKSSLLVEVGSDYVNLQYRGKRPTTILFDREIPSYQTAIESKEMCSP